MNLAEELEGRGWADGYDAFEEIVLDTFTSLFPGWTDETLLLHPGDAVDFCKRVRVLAPLTGSRKEVEYFITRVLVNNRKHRKRAGRGTSTSQKAGVT